jgi:hypothetical protein
MNDSDTVTIKVDGTTVSFSQTWQNIKEGEPLTWTTALTSGSYTLRIQTTGATDSTVSFTVTTAGGGGTCTQGPGTSCGTVCPAGSYAYCSGSSVSQVFIQNGCSPSGDLVSKLVREGKLTSTNDTKIVNCSLSGAPDACAGKNFPTVVCSDASQTTITGYCP